MAAKHFIEVTDIRVYAHHGCMPEETIIGGHYSVDVWIETDFTEAAQHDNISKTVDYVDVNRLVVEEMKQASKLIEHVGQRIVNRLKTELAGLHKLRVKIIKYNPPINGDVKQVAIIIEEDCK
jgi:7,8-dihydroneopterin aldolase/epimerase/oxygenase